ncbi:SseB protein N-terminal domain-containing protein [Streptomyces sp. 2323.1]|uniref:type VII secretion system-associated protein n=1 Tax=Streptomyces sp. 2323.1 TaxID=1938841 RepID=UPI000BB729F6|nr:type VII secretion system-associated protein [Streptomyces sp. 2323.1]SOE09538.1 SseB protein N-terminal domain-containing protein [Streptomyces sp. 2323.1]
MEESTQAAMTAGVPVTGQEMPEPPPEVIEAARNAPDHWLAMVDLTWQGEGPPPLWSLIGQWRSGPTGEIEEWRDNPEYRPSPQMLDWPEPADAVDNAVQLAATGYGPGQDVSEALARAEVSVLVTATGSPLAAASPEGTPVIPVYTSQSYLESVGRLLYDRRPVAALVEQLPPGHALYLNPTGPVSMLVDTEELRAALAGASGTADEARTPATPSRPGTGAGGAEPVSGGRAIGKPARAANGSTVVGAGMASSGVARGAN